MDRASLLQYSARSCALAYLRSYEWPVVLVHENVLFDIDVNMADRHDPQHNNLGIN